MHSLILQLEHKAKATVWTKGSRCLAIEPELPGPDQAQRDFGTKATGAVPPESADHDGATDDALAA